MISRVEMAETQTGKNIEKRSNKDDILGVYTEIFSAKTSIEGQDGGVVTAMLVYGLSEDMFDVVVVVQHKKGTGANIIVSKKLDEVHAARGTKYVKMGTASKLKHLVGQGKKRIAVVCTPCQATAARKIEQALKHEEPDLKVTVIGLFCFEAFNYEKLKTETRRLLGVDLDEAEKVQVRKGNFIVHSMGKAYSCSIGDLANAIEAGCSVCGDFSARFADISVGSVGSRNGYSTVIVRSEAGSQLLQGLTFDRETVDKEEILRLCRVKKKRAEKTAFLRGIQGKSE